MLKWSKICGGKVVDSEKRGSGMKRNVNGINIDEGIPLADEAEFDILYADLYPTQAQQLNDWLCDGNDQSALALGGQIGSGKSTLLNKVVSTATVEPDVWLNFDEDASNPSLGDFIAITLAGLIEAILTNHLAFIDSSTLIDDLLIEFDGTLIDEMSASSLASHWQILHQRLNPSKKSLKGFREKSLVVGIINDAKNTPYFLTAITALIEDFKQGSGRFPLIVASGIDKFPAGSPAFFVLKAVLEKLQDAKTLYEINAIHFYAAECQFSSMNTLLLPSVEHSAIVKLLLARLGVYAGKHQNNVSILAEFSGGNPRQAVRLLMHYLREKKDRSLTEQGAIAKAVKQTSVDYFSFSERPETELINAVANDHFLLSAMISRPGDASTALKAVYGNWVFLGNDIDSDKRAAIVNPIVQGVFSGQSTGAEYMQSALKKYAEALGISPTGLSFDDSSEHSRRLGFDALFSEIDEFVDTNLVAVFDEMSASLLNKNRPDRAFIVYRDKLMSDAARAYLLAKSNTFEHQSYRHFEIDYESGKSVTEVIDNILCELDQHEHPIDILSVEFAADWPVEELVLLESKRDCFLHHQILWWLSDGQLKAILPGLVQLRQLFEVYSLHDTLLASLSVADITADIEYLTSFNDKACEQQIMELKIVADYLSQHKGELL